MQNILIKSLLVLFVAAGLYQLLAPSNPPLPPARSGGLVDATGRPVSLADYHGRYLWIDYAAPWCSPCIPQAQAIAHLEQELASDVVFITILTSQEVMRPADVQTAQDWAARFALVPQRVWVGDNPALTIPLHVFYAPDGGELYRHTGPLDGAQIHQVVREQARR